jgi:beta-phosphoglucomutase
MYKACLFDLDGVLVDTAIYHFQAWKMLGENFNYQLTEEQNEQLKGVSRVESLNRILDWANYSATDEQKEAWLVEKNENYLQLISTMNPAEILPGVLDFLGQIKELGYKIALGSASKNSEVILTKTDLLPWFDLIIFLKGAEGLGFKPEECIVFEDAQAGVEAAKKGGMKAIGIGDADVLSEADKVIPTFIGIKATELLKF